MSHLHIRVEAESGDIVEIVPTEFEPLTAAQLERAALVPDEPLDIAFVGRDAKVNGSPLDGTPRVTSKINFRHALDVVALVPGGWLPVPFATPQHFLVDRNVISKMRSIRVRGSRSNDEAFRWWIQMFEGSTAMYNPVLTAFEGSQQRVPTLDELVLSFTAARDELLSFLPKANVVSFGREHFDAAYAQVRALDERREKEIAFLLRSVPRLLNRTPRYTERSTETFLLEVARELGVEQQSPVVLAALSTLYEDIHGNRLSYGRLVLKPKKSYTREDAYNAISDLHHIVLAGAGHAFLPGSHFSLCTADRGLALFWSSLRFLGSDSGDNTLDLQYTMTTDLLYRLEEAEVLELAARLCGDA